MRVLGIESSCDETAVALYDSVAKRLLGHALHSQVALHAQYGGVVPELASRDHLSWIVDLVQQCMMQAQCDYAAIDAIAYTQGPGLSGCLLVGASFAHGLSLVLNKPLIPVHHLEAHLLSPLLAEPHLSFPFLVLLVSGGHTQIFHAREVGVYEFLGESIDDAAGEAFDKVAKILGLPYPGGAALSYLAEEGDPDYFTFPRPLIKSRDLNMSFSGLKTAVYTKVQVLTNNGSKTLSLQQKQHIAASFQAAVIEVLTTKIQMALQQTGLNRLVVAGGVGANLRLRQALQRLEAEIFFPPIEWCTDNGAMVALAGALHLEQAQREYTIVVKPRWPLS